MTPLQDRERAVTHLARIRDQVHALHGAEHTRAHDEGGAFLDTRSGGEVLTIVRFQPHASEDEIRLLCTALEDLRFLLALYDRAVRVIRDLRPAPAASKQTQAPDTTKDFAAEAAMKCGEPAFLKFLEERHGLARPLTPERATQRLRSVLAIGSRRELNEGGDAARRWTALRTDFENWKRQ